MFGVVCARACVLVCETALTHLGHAVKVKGSRAALAGLRPAWKQSVAVGQTDS